MSYLLRYHPDVLRIDLSDIDRKLAARIGAAIEQRLTTHPTDYGSPLRHTLKGYWKLRVGDYRVVYRIVSQEVRIVAIMHRSHVYERLGKRIND